MLSRSEQARKVARCIGLRTFKGCWNLAELLNDCESVAWQLEKSAPKAVKPGCIGYLAVKRVRIGRQFKQSIRSITTGRQDKRSKRPVIRQIVINLEDVAAVDAPPSESVPGWMDVQEWLRSYDARKRAIAEALASGETTQNVARQFEVSDGRISQMRREFIRDYARFQGESQN